MKVQILQKNAIIELPDHYTPEQIESHIKANWHRITPQSEPIPILMHYINKSAIKHGVHPSLVKAVIETESSWNPQAISKKGAQGLMQLMPKTAKGLGVKKPFDVIENIEGGVKYLSQLKKQFNGNVSKALFAYNAGASRVGQNIPESKQYVSKIMSIYNPMEKPQQPMEVSQNIPESKQYVSKIMSIYNPMEKPQQPMEVSQKPIPSQTENLYQEQMGRISQALTSEREIL